MQSYYVKQWNVFTYSSKNIKYWAMSLFTILVSFAILFWIIKIKFKPLSPPANTYNYVTNYKYTPWETTVRNVNIDATLRRYLVQFHVDVCTGYKGMWLTYLEFYQWP